MYIGTGRSIAACEKRLKTADSWSDSTLPPSSGDKKKLSQANRSRGRIHTSVGPEDSIIFLRSRFLRMNERTEIGSEFSCWRITTLKRKMQSVYQIIFHRELSMFGYVIYNKLCPRVNFQPKKLSGFIPWRNLRVDVCIYIYIPAVCWNAKFRDCDLNTQEKCEFCNTPPGTRWSKFMVEACVSL